MLRIVKRLKQDSNLEEEAMNCLYQITGGTGLVGTAMERELSLRYICGTCPILPAQYLNRDLSSGLVRADSVSTELCVPTKGLIHLAAKVGGVQSNSRSVSDFFEENMKLNQSVFDFAIKNKIPKVLSLMSTCVYPAEKYVKYPLTEEQLHNGPPHESNFGYAYAKRMLDVQSRAYRQQYGYKFITAIPNNLYGINDNFHLENGHVIPTLIRKIWEAKLNNTTPTFWGDGSPLREFTYAGDIAKILISLMEHYNDSEPVNVGNSEEISIRDLVFMICEELEYEGKISWDESRPSGQFRKPSSNKKLLSLGHWEESNYTTLKQGLKLTCDWFKLNYPNIRGVI